MHTRMERRPRPGCKRGLTGTTARGLYQRACSSSSAAMVYGIERALTMIACLV
jgi:hypothetical protein